MYNIYNEFLLISDKEYPIIKIDGNYFYINSEIRDMDFFHVESLSKYFDIKQETPKFERYLVVYNSTSLVYDNYDLALDKAKKLCKSNEVVHIYKAITKVELNDVKITEL